MSSKKILLIIILLALGGVALWWFTRPKAEAPFPAKVAAAPLALKFSTDASAPKPAQVEAPKAAPVPAANRVQIDELASSAAIPPPTDPCAELDSYIPYLQSLLATGDYARYIEISTPPDELMKINASPGGLEQYIQDFEQRPDFSQLMQMYLQALPRLKGVTPVYNDTGNFATYTLEATANQGPSRIGFRKINGRWY